MVRGEVEEGKKDRGRCKAYLGGIKAKRKANITMYTTTVCSKQ